MFDGFSSELIDTAETRIIVRRAGSGPPVLLLHGFPQTHLMWRDVAPLLAREFTVVCADLRGYGKSGCPPSTADHHAYTKRAMAADMVSVMARLGFSRFSVAGHDRGGRVAYRLALDHPEQAMRVAVLDVLPTEVAWTHADARFALGYWPWAVLAQPSPLPEQVLTKNAEAVVDNALDTWDHGYARRPWRYVVSMSRRCAILLMRARSARSIVREQLSTERTTKPMSQLAAASAAHCSPCGARTDRSTPGIRLSPVHSHFGGNGPMTFAGEQ